MIEQPKLIDNFIVVYYYDPATFTYLHSLVVDADKPGGIDDNTTLVEPPDFDPQSELAQFDTLTEVWTVSDIPSPLDIPKHDAYKMIDTRIHTVLNRVSTPEAQTAGLYDLKYTESLQYFADGEPIDLTDYPLLTVSTTVTGMTATECANEIISKRNEYVIQLASIEDIRLLAKADIAAIAEDGVATIAELITEIYDIADTAVIALDNL